MEDIPANVVALAGIIVLGILGFFMLQLGIDTVLLETVIILISGLSGYKIKETIDKKTIEELKAATSVLRPDKN